MSLTAVLQAWMATTMTLGLCIHQEKGNAGALTVQGVHTLLHSEDHAHRVLHSQSPYSALGHWDAA